MRIGALAIVRPSGTLAMAWERQDIGVGESMGDAIRVRYRLLGRMARR